MAEDEYEDLLPACEVVCIIKLYDCKSKDITEYRNEQLDDVPKRHSVTSFQFPPKEHPKSQAQRRKEFKHIPSLHLIPHTVYQ